MGEARSRRSTCGSGAVEHVASSALVLLHTPATEKAAGRAAAMRSGVVRPRLEATAGEQANDPWAELRADPYTYAHQKRRERHLLFELSSELPRSPRGPHYVRSEVARQARNEGHRTDANDASGSLLSVYNSSSVPVCMIVPSASLVLSHSSSSAHDWNRFQTFLDEPATGLGGSAVWSAPTAGRR